MFFVFLIFAPRTETDMKAAVERGDENTFVDLFASSSASNCISQIRQHFLLHEAVKKKRYQILNLLLEYIFKKDRKDVLLDKDRDKDTALHLAVDMKLLEFTKLIIESYPATLTQKDGYGNTPIHYIVTNKFVEGCTIAMEHAEPKYIAEQNNQLLTAVHLAARENTEPILKLLLHKISNSVDLLNPESLYTPLHCAAETGASKCIKTLLLSIPKNVVEHYTNLQNKNKMTALMIAAKLGYTACCTTMKMADINMSNDMGYTALHFAAMRGNRGIVKHLVEQKADISKRTLDDDLTALSYAAGAKNPDCLEYMLNNCELTDLPNVLKTATQRDNDECLELLLDRDDMKKFINHKFKECRNDTLLHMSIKNGNYKISRMLLEKEAKKLKNDNDEYPFHLLAKQQISQCKSQKDWEYVCSKILTHIQGLIGDVTR